MSHFHNKKVLIYASISVWIDLRVKSSKNFWRKIKGLYKKGIKRRMKVCWVKIQYFTFCQSASKDLHHCCVALLPFLKSIHRTLHHLPLTFLPWGPDSQLMQTSATPMIPLHATWFLFRLCLRVTLSTVITPVVRPDTGWVSPRGLARSDLGILAEFH